MSLLERERDLNSAKIRNWKRIIVLSKRTILKCRNLLMVLSFPTVFSILNAKRNTWY